MNQQKIGIVIASPEMGIVSRWGWGDEAIETTLLRDVALRISIPSLYEQICLNSRDVV